MSGEGSADDPHIYSDSMTVSSTDIENSHNINASQDNVNKVCRLKLLRASLNRRNEKYSNRKNTRIGHKCKCKKERAAENSLHRSRRQKRNFGRSSGQCSLDQGHRPPLTITVASNPVDNQSSSRFSISLTWYKEPRLTLKFRVLGRGNGKHRSRIHLNLAGKTLIISLSGVV